MFNDERFQGRVERVRTDVLPGLDVAPYTHGPLDKYLDHLREAMAVARYHAIWSHPDYREVITRMIALGLPGEGAPSPMSETLRDPIRFTMAIWAMGLHLTPGGLTYARFHGMTQLVKAGSRTMTYALFGYLRFLRYIEPAPEAGDRREKRFRPTPLLHEALRGHLAAGLMAIRAMDPVAGAIGDRIASEDRVYDAVVRNCSDGMLAGALVEQTEGPGILAVINRRRSGSAMLWALFKAAPEDETWPSARPFPVKVAELSRWSGASRPHFTRMLREAEAAGLLSLDSGGMLTLEQALRDEMNALVAFNVICFGLAARYTEEALLRDQAA